MPLDAEPSWLSPCFRPSAPRDRSDCGGTLDPAVTVMQTYEAGVVGGGVLVGVDTAAWCLRWGGSGGGLQGVHDQQHFSPVNKTHHPFPGEERKHLDDSAGSGRHGC